MIVIPTGMVLPQIRRPSGVYTLIILNVLLHGVTMEAEDRHYLIYPLGFFADPHPPLKWLAQLCLQPNSWHLALNMTALYLVGGNVEEVLGKARFLTLYLLAGLSAALAYLIVPPALGASTPIIGAAGAVSGIVGAYLVLFPKMPVDVEVALLFWHVRTIRSNALGVTLLWLSYQLVFALFQRFDPWQIGIIFWAHLGGLIGGSILAWLLNRGRAQAAAYPPREPTPATRSLTKTERGLLGGAYLWLLLAIFIPPFQFARLWEPPPVTPAGPVPSAHAPLTPTNAPFLRLLTEWNTGEMTQQAAISAGGRWLVLDRGQELSFWDAQSGTRLSRSEPPDAWSLTFTPADTLLVLEERDSEMWLTEWDREGTALKAEKLNHYRPNAADLSPTGEWVIAMLITTGPEVWRTPDGAVVTKLGLTARAQSPRQAWSADGRFLVVANGEEAAPPHLWQFPEGKRLQTFAVGNLRATALALSPKGETVAIAASGGRLEIWGNDGVRRYATRLPTNDYIHKLTFSPDGSLLAVGTDQGAILVVQASDGTLLTLLHHPLERTSDPLPHYMVLLGFTTDGRLVSADNIGFVRWWGIPPPEASRRQG